jgi:hypothetical protein
MSNDKKIDDVGLNDWFELDQAIKHARLMK